MPEEEQRRSFLSKLPADVLVTLAIAIVAVAVTAVSFKQRTLDFEAAAKEEIAGLAARLEAIESRERSNTAVLVRLDTHVENLRRDVQKIGAQMTHLVIRLSGGRISGNAPVDTLFQE